MLLDSKILAGNMQHNIIHLSREDPKDIRTFVNIDQNLFQDYMRNTVGMVGQRLLAR